MNQNWKKLVLVFAAGLLVVFLAVFGVYRAYTSPNDPFTGRWQQDSAVGLISRDNPKGTVLDFTGTGDIKGGSKTLGHYVVLNGGQIRIIPLQGEEHLYNYRVSLQNLTLSSPEGGYRYLRK